MTFDIQTIFNFYASSFLCLTLAWFATVGYLAHACVLMLLTKLSFRTVFQPLLRFHVISLAITYVCTPVITTLFCWLVAMWYAPTIQLPYQVMFIYFAWLHYWISTIFLCSFFKQTSCNKFKQALFAADVAVMVLGYFVLLLVQQNFGIIG